MSKKKFLPALLNIDVMVAGICFLLLVALTFLGVVFRYAFNDPILWQEEVQVWLFLWIVFFGGSAAFRARSHVAIELVVETLPAKTQRVVELLVNSLVIVVLGFLVKYSCILIRQFANTGKSTSVAMIPNALISAAVPIGCALMILNLVLTTVQDFRAKRCGKKEEAAA
jgi:TRAP-type C4-dicarboxylate transport system, small permease component